MTAPDPRVGEIEARVSAHYESVAYEDDIAEGCEELFPENYERHYCAEDGKDWPCPDVTDYAQEDIRYLLAELRKAHEALADAKAEALREAAEHFKQRSDTYFNTMQEMTASKEYGLEDIVRYGAYSAEANTTATWLRTKAAVIRNNS